MATKTTKKPTAKTLTDAYIKRLLIHGERPKSVFAFADELGMSESEFYNFFSSFESLEEAVWKGFMEDTLKAIQKDENYAGFTAREKLLAFYFTHLEVLRENRSYVVMRWPEVKKSPKSPGWLKHYKEMYYEYVREVIAEGMEGGEIKDRKYLSERYDKALWVQLVFVVDYWCNDTSKDFENSDAAIEKAVTLSFQLLGESALDNALDFAKFIWQSK